MLRSNDSTEKRKAEQSPGSAKGKTMLKLYKGIILLVILSVALTSLVFARGNRTTSHAALAYSAGRHLSNAAELPTVSLSDLPTEAKRTLALIKQGGPFPYPRDGITFGNREGLLPARQKGYYREYTVKTPGSRDRGARRIIAGSGGEFYYTDDHYRTFKRIKE